VIWGKLLDLQLPLTHELANQKHTHSLYIQGSHIPLKVVDAYLFLSFSMTSKARDISVSCLNCFGTQLAQPSGHS